MTITPNTALGPVRAGDGATRPGRLTTHEERRQEVIRELGKRAAKRGETEVRDTVKWPDGYETIVVVSMTIEHIDGQPVYITDRVTEYAPNGAEIPRDPAAAMRRLSAEVEELFEKGQV